MAISQRRYICFGRAVFFKDASCAFERTKRNFAIGRIFWISSPKIRARITILAGAPGKNQFSDVVGGVSELAYDGTNFYAFGGSWLFVPSNSAEYVRIAKPDQMYIDLGIRFVADPPATATATYGELVQKLALQCLTTEN